MGTDRLEGTGDPSQSWIEMRTITLSATVAACPKKRGSFSLHSFLYVLQIAPLKHLFSPWPGDLSNQSLTLSQVLKLSTKIASSLWNLLQLLSSLNENKKICKIWLRILKTRMMFFPVLNALYFFFYSHLWNLYSKYVINATLILLLKCSFFNFWTSKHFVPPLWHY